MKALEHRLAPWVILAVTLAIALTTITIGFYTDDYAIRAGLSGQWPNGPAAWDLYRFTYGGVTENQAAIASSALPWWATPAMKLHLVRPLTSLSFLLDSKVFGASPLGWHLHSIAWYVLLVHLVGCVLRALLPRRTANLAMLVYALSAAHFLVYGWIASRHMSIAAAVGMIGVLALVRGHRLARWIFAGCLAIGLVAGETGIAIAVFGIVFVVVKTPRGALAKQLAPAALVLLAWLAFYVAVGGGASHSDGYVDPTSAPGRFAIKAVTMLPVMIGNATFGVPAEMVSVVSAGPFVIVGVVAAIFLVAMWRGVRGALAEEERSALPWLVAAALLATAPSLGGFPGARILLVPNVGFAALVAVLVVRGLEAIDGGSRLGRIARGAGASLLVLVHVVAAPVLDLGNTSFNAKVARDHAALVAGIDISDMPPGDVRLFVIGASDPLITMYPPIMSIVTSPELRARLRCWSVISPTRSDHDLRRTGPRSFTVRPTSGRMLEGPFEALYRSRSDPFRAGDEVRQCNVVYRIVAVDEGRPTEIELTFDTSLDDPSLRLLRWDGARFARLTPPPIGEAMVIPWSKGPLGMF
ncbi:MAG: hypothetical protein JST00_25350 [Deltaproteobacteria bacterium]|nr:hypothetical protein [Deltaproteobacteria bacterium]